MLHASANFTRQSVLGLSEGIDQQPVFSNQRMNKESLVIESGAAKSKIIAESGTLNAPVVGRQANFDPYSSPCVARTRGFPTDSVLVSSECAGVTAGVTAGINAGVGDAAKCLRFRKNLRGRCAENSTHAHAHKYQGCPAHSGSLEVAHHNNSGARENT